jgi:hypothetical protein
MTNIIKSKEKEASLNGTEKIFGIIRRRENFQHIASLSSLNEMTKKLLNYKKQTDLTKDKAITQTRFLTRLL